MHKEVIVDYKLDKDNKPERPDPNYGPGVNKEEKKDFDAEYAKVEPPCLGTYKQKMIHHQLGETIWCMHAAHTPDIMAS